MAADHVDDDAILVEKIEGDASPVPSAPPLPADEFSDASPAHAEVTLHWLLGSNRSVHAALGGGGTADVLLWKNKNMTASILGSATIIWVLFEIMNYHLLPLICRVLIFSLGSLFLWSKASIFINKDPPKIPELSIPEDVIVRIALALRYQVNKSIALLLEIATGHEFKKLLMVIAGLWLLSIFSSWWSFLTLFYIVVIMLHTGPLLYKNYGDKVDPLAERALVEGKKYYAVFNAQVLSKMPGNLGPLKAKKQ